MTNILMNLPTDPVLSERARRCISLYNGDVQFFPNSTEIVNLVSDYPCPRTLNQVVNDPARFILQTESPRCYVSSLPKISNTVALQISATQQCCYDNKNG